MPPRKSNMSTATNGDADISTVSIPKSRESINVEDLNLPRTIIQRLSKGVLPSNTQIQRDAVLALSKSATVFINFLAASASENALANGKKTIMPHDVLAALKDQEFEEFVPRVQAEVAKYNEVQTDKRNTYRRSKKAGQQTTEIAEGDAMDVSGIGGDSVAVAANGHPEGDDEERPSKKVRREDGDEEVSDEGEVEEEVEISEEEVEEDSGDEEEVEVEVEEDDEQEISQDSDAGENDYGNGLHGGLRDEALDEPDSD